MLDQMGQAVFSPVYSLCSWLRRALPAGDGCAMPGRAVQCCNMYNASLAGLWPNCCPVGQLVPAAGKMFCRLVVVLVFRRLHSPCGWLHRPHQLPTAPWEPCAPPHLGGNSRWQLMPQQQPPPTTAIWLQSCEKSTLTRHRSRGRRLKIPHFATQAPPRIPWLDQASTAPFVGVRTRHQTIQHGACAPRHPQKLSSSIFSLPARRLLLSRSQRSTTRRLYCSHHQCSSGSIQRHPSLTDMRPRQ